MPDFCLSDATASFTNKTTIADGSLLTYLWDFGDKNANAQHPNTSAMENPSHVYTEVGYYKVTLTVTSANNCEYSVTKTFTVNGSTPKPNFTVQNAAGLCSDQPVMFLDNSTVDFGEITKIEWYYDYTNNPTLKETDNDPALRSATARIYSHTYPTFNTPISKTITVKMMAYSGLSCVQEITKAIVLQAVPNIVFDAIPAICEEKSPVQLTQGKETTNFPGTGTYSGPGVSVSGLFDPSLAGPGSHTIIYTFTGSNGCGGSKSQTVTVYPAPTADAGKDVRILEGGQTMLAGTGSGSNLKYKWSPSIGLDKDDILNPIASPTDDITYVLTVTSDQGCSAVDAIFVKVLKSPEVPNTFTPNNDGINDNWNIKYLESYPGATVDVYNRFGSKIFSSLGYPQPWDGTTERGSLPEGTYFYIINPRNGRKIISGSVTILR
jgi:gliding motility-associated-like protein